MASPVSDVREDRPDVGRPQGRRLAGSPSGGSITILGVEVEPLSVDAAIERVRFELSTPTPSRIVYFNAACANLAWRDPAYRSILETSDLLLNDGAGLEFAARLQRQRFPANLNGTDFTPEVLRLAVAQGLRVYLLGGEPGVAERARERLVESHPGLRVVGTHHGFLRGRQSEEVVDRIRRARTDVLLVGMGAPRQEYWLHRYLECTGARLGVGVGAFIDFSSGRIARAPDRVRKLKFEWLFRLAREPRRLFARYVLGNPLFLVRVGLYSLGWLRRETRGGGSPTTARRTTPPATGPRRT